MFAERGFDSAKLQDISRLAGVSMGTIYAVFPGKEDLFRAILAERGRELLQVARDGAHSHGDPRAALDGLIAAYIDYFIDTPSFCACMSASAPSGVGTGRAIAGAGRGGGDHARRRSDRRGVAAVSRRRGPAAFLAKIFSALDQWCWPRVGGGMKPRARTSAPCRSHRR